MQSIALMYHDVVPDGRFELSGFQDPDANIYKLDEDEFRRQMRIIAEYSAPKSIVITVDDGGSGAMKAAEIIENAGCAGSFFITTDRIGTPGFLNDGQVWSLRRRGHRVGSHSCSHPPRISHCSPQEIERQWRESTARLAAILDEPVTTASVPGGFYSREVAAAAARAGIRTLYTSEPVTSVRMVDGCAVKGRFAVRRGASEEWVRKLVSGSWEPRVRQYLAWNLRKAAKRVGGEAWLAARAHILARGAEASSETKSKGAAGMHG